MAWINFYLGLGVGSLIGIICGAFVWEIVRNDFGFPEAHEEVKK